jgi:hypothetical protein
MRVSFVMQGDRATGIAMDSEGGGRPLAGDRIGGADPQTFQQRPR